MKEFIKRLAVEYANICDTVVAPSESVSNILSERGVDSDIRVIPTGIHTDVFASGDGTRFRKRFNIPSENCVAGFVSRIAPEKNLDLLCRGAAEFCARENGRTFVAVGDGPGTETVKRIMKEEGAADSLVMTGALEGEDLSDAYNAMDFFAFCSKTETQGLVVAEAMAAGLPVAALSAPGVREVMRDGHNGFIFTEEKPSALAQTLERLSQLSSNTYRGMSEEARESAREYSVDTCAHTMLDLYRELNESAAGAGERETGLFDRTRRRIESEWNMIRSKLRATGAALEEINPFQESRSS